MFDKTFSNPPEADLSKESFKSVPIKFKVLVEGGATCGAGGQCPTVYQVADGSIAIQGYKLSDEQRNALSIPNGEDIILLPADFFNKILDSFKQKTHQ